MKERKTRPAGNGLMVDHGECGGVTVEKVVLTNLTTGEETEIWPELEAELEALKSRPGFRIINTNLDGLVRIDQLEEELEATKDKLREIESSPDCFYELYKQAEARAEDTEAKLRELAEAAEWRDECLDCFIFMEAMNFCGDAHDGAHEESEASLDASEEQYIDALKAAKEV